MQIKDLYKYTREDGGITISPNKPDCECTLLYRIIADEGKVLTKDGINHTICADVASTEGWYEIDMPEEGEISNEYASTGNDTVSNNVTFSEEDIEYAKAGRILLGVEE